MCKGCSGEAAAVHAADCHLAVAGRRMCAGPCKAQQRRYAPRVRPACGLGLARAPMRSAPAALPAARTGTTAGAPASISCEGVSRPPRATTTNSVSATGAGRPGPGAYAREAAAGACAAGSAPSAAGEPALAAGSRGRPPVRARVRLYQLAGPCMRTVWRKCSSHVRHALIRASPRLLCLPCQSAVLHDVSGGASFSMPRS